MSKDIQTQPSWSTGFKMGIMGEITKGGMNLQIVKGLE